MSLNVPLLQMTFQRAKHENGGLKTLGSRFYERLFEKYPNLRALFHTPLEEQQQKLMASLEAMISMITHPDKMQSYLQEMSARHIAYQVENRHYGAICENLLAVLGEHLSKEGDWTSEMRFTWNDALASVSKTMVKAAERPNEDQSS